MTEQERLELYNLYLQLLNFNFSIEGRITALQNQARLMKVVNPNVIEYDDEDLIRVIFNQIATSRTLAKRLETIIDTISESALDKQKEMHNVWLSNYETHED